AGPPAAPPVVHEVLGSPGQPLDPRARTFFEARFGHDFSHVRVHADEKAAASARAVGAVAYTVGPDIVFESGQYKPGSLKGRWLLAHELAHVAQQSRNDAPLPSGLSLSQPGDPYETEAEHLAAQTFLPSSKAAAGPSLESPPTVQRVHPALAAAGVLAAVGACAYGFYRYTLSNYSAAQGYNDKFMHCYASCKVASWCGGGPLGPSLIVGMAISEVAGILKEIADYIKNELHIGTPADASWDDWIADQFGILCAANTFQSCASCCRRAPGATVPVATAAAGEPSGAAVAAGEAEPAAPEAGPEQMA
ncbi:MAG: DUF4157 domain-containing protein, partial [Acidobacteriota bacterium]|nr:DUF4157 domain-containing protein [Acidobacteriota bacterium]